MSALVRIEDIDEFESIRRIPRVAISDAILAGIRQLDEPAEIEAFLRDIIPDKNNTPHTSTEIVDILTPHVTVKGKAVFSAFINKGKSFPTVTARNVSNQIFKLRRLRSLDLVVLLAVGHIQDDAVENFLITANDLQASYMLIDAIDVARLFIAYQKVCPVDGHALKDTKCPKCSYTADRPITLSIDVAEEPRYHVIRSHDKSSGVAKRYAVDVLTDPHYTKGTLREIIKQVVWEYRHEDFYRSRITQNLFRTKEADCVFLSLFIDPRDLQQYNWIANAIWISPKLPANVRPFVKRGMEKLDDIAIEWKSDYYALHQFWLGQRGSKSEWIAKIESSVAKIESTYNEANLLIQRFRNDQLPVPRFLCELKTFEQKTLELFLRATEGKIPPLDCQECDSYFKTMAGSFHNVFIWFADHNAIERDDLEKVRLMDRHIEKYEQDRMAFIHEWKKIRR